MIVTTFKQLFDLDDFSFEKVEIVSIVSDKLFSGEYIVDDLNLPLCKSFTIITPKHFSLRIKELILHDCDNFHVHGLSIDELCFIRNLKKFIAEECSFGQVVHRKIESLVIKKGEFPEMDNSEIIGDLKLVGVSFDNSTLAFKNAKNVYLENNRNSYVNIILKEVSNLEFRNCIFASVFFTKTVNFIIMNCEIKRFLCFSSVENKIVNEDNTIEHIIGDKNYHFGKKGSCEIDSDFIENLMS